MASLHVANELVKAITNIIYPVGSIYISISSANPSSFLGGTWSRVSNGRCLLGVDENNADANMKSSNLNGGWPTHNHTTGNHTLTINEIPSHRHDFANGGRNLMWDSNLPSYGGLTSGTTVQYTWDCRTNDTGGGQAHNHGNTGNGTSYPPFYSCYIWRRTA